MADPRDIPPQTGAVPSFVVPPQVSGPHALPAGWFPLPQSPEPKPEKHAGIKLAIQIIMAALGLGGVIFAGGVAREKLSNIEANQKASDGLRLEEKRQQAEARREVREAIERIEKKVDSVAAEQAKQARRGGRRRAPEVDTHP